MKFFRSATCALVASHAFAAPIVDGPAVDGTPELIEFRSRNPADAALATLEKRSICRVLDRVIRSIGTSKNVVVYMTAGTNLASAVCALANGANCGQVVNLVATGIYVVYLAAAHYSGAVPEGLPTKRGEDVEDAYVLWWKKSIADSDLSYQDITALPDNATEEALNRRDGEPRLLARVLLSGVANNANDQSVTQNIMADHYEDGSTVLNLPLESPSNHLRKRFDGAGFKISYTTRGKSLLSRSHQVDMANSVALHWAAYAEYDNMDEFIGFAETDHTANFYYRIIPEVRGFGTNYESVDVCGGMAQYL